MGKIMNLNIEEINDFLSDKNPLDIVKWAVSIAENPVITTNFRPYEVAILNAVTEVKKRY